MRPVLSSHGSQECIPVPLMGHGIVWVERNSTLEFFLSTCPVPIVMEERHCQRIARLRKGLIYLESCAGRCFRFEYVSLGERSSRVTYASAMAAQARV